MLLSAVCMFSIMMVVIADVTMRYLLSMPLAWSYDVISLYLMVGMFFFGVSDTLRSGGHIGIDILQKFIPPRLRDGVEAIGYLAMTAIIAAMAYLAFDRSLSAWLKDEAMSGSYLWPTWLAYVPVFVGMAAMGLRALYITIIRAYAAWSGTSRPHDEPDVNMEEAI